MSSYFNLNESLENLVRDLKTGAEQFARAMASEADAQGKTDSCFNGTAGGTAGGHFGGAKDFSFNFENLGYPRHETYEQADGSLVYRFQLPGFDESCINLSFRGDLMILKATVPERLRAESAEGRQSFLRDIDRREYRVPADRYDQTAVKAVFKNGILTVTIPPKDEDMSGAIKVEIIKEGN
jgi:HSP20 family molecular chaperone IbpA